MKLHREVFVCDFGVVELPETPSVRMKANGWPDRRFKEGRRYQAYLNAVTERAKAAYLDGAFLAQAAPYSEWVRNG